MTKDLYEHQAASRMALQQAESDLAKNRGKVQQTEEAMRVLGLDVARSEGGALVASRIPVRAPLGGTVLNGLSPLAVDDAGDVAFAARDYVFVPKGLVGLPEQIRSIRSRRRHNSDEKNSTQVSPAQELAKTK